MSDPQQECLCEPTTPGVRRLNWQCPVHGKMSTGAVPSVSTAHKAECLVCHCTTGGGQHCYEHAPYMVYPQADGSFLVDRNGRKRVWLDDLPAAVSPAPQEQELIGLPDWMDRFREGLERDQLSADLFMQEISGLKVWAQIVRKALATNRSAVSTPDLSWQPIETAPKDGTQIIGALIRNGVVWRVHDMKHNGLAFYTRAGGSLPEMTHWLPMPALQDLSVPTPAQDGDSEV